MSNIKLPFINTITITGRLTADPNLNYTPNGAGTVVQADEKLNIQKNQLRAYLPILTPYHD